MKPEIKLIKKTGTWHLTYGDNFSSLGVGYNVRTGGYPTSAMVRREFPERIAETTALLIREGTASPYAFSN